MPKGNQKSKEKLCVLAVTHWLHIKILSIRKWSFKLGNSMIHSTYMVLGRCSSNKSKKRVLKMNLSLILWVIKNRSMHTYTLWRKGLQKGQVKFYSLLMNWTNIQMKVLCLIWNARKKWNPCLLIPAIKM